MAPVGFEFAASAAAKRLQPADIVVVFGATGGLGQLVVRKLAMRGRYRVRAVARDPPAAARLLVGCPDVEIVLGATTLPDTLPAALKGAAAVIVTTGTTAFPTQRWFKGDTPKAVDYEGVRNVVEAAPPSLKLFMLVTSIGLERRDEMPFKFLNLFGVIDEKRKGELAVEKGARAKGYDFQFLRPGRLVGGPYTNPDLAKLLQADLKDDCQAVMIRKGDEGLSDCGRWSCSEAVVELLEAPRARNLALSICNTTGPTPASSEAWQKLIDAAVP